MKAIVAFLLAASAAVMAQEDCPTTYAIQDVYNYLTCEADKCGFMDYNYWQVNYGMVRRSLWDGFGDDVAFKSCLKTANKLTVANLKKKGKDLAEWAPAAGRRGFHLADLGPKSRPNSGEEAAAGRQMDYDCWFPYSNSGNTANTWSGTMAGRQAGGTGDDWTGASTGRQGYDGYQEIGADNLGPCWTWDVMGQVFDSLFLRCLIEDFGYGSWACGSMNTASGDGYYGTGTGNGFSQGGR